MKKDKLYLTLLLEAIDDERLPMPFYVSRSAAIGYVDEENMIFTDILTSQKYVNVIKANEIGLIDGYTNPIPISNFKTGLFLSKEKLSEYFNFMDHMVFLIMEDNSVTIMPTSKFEEELGVKLNLSYIEETNDLLEALVSGKLNVTDYLKSTEDSLNNNTDKSKEIENVIKEKLDKPISEVIAKVKESIINQDEAVKQVITAVYKYAIFGSKFKSNILIYGPSGCGKTALIKEVSKILGMPIHIEDMTKFTVSGYKGASVEDILVSLYKENNGDLEAAEHSILFLDEIDKKAKTESDNEVTSSGVLKSLLKIVEGDTIEVEINPTTGETISFDTSKLLVIAGGAFTDLYNQKAEEKKNTVGFGNEVSSINKEIQYGTELTIKDFEKFGMPLEFMGRFKTIIRMNKLKLEDLVNILKTSNLSEMKSYVDLLESKGIKLDIPEQLYEKIAELAYSYGTGARGLNIVVDNIFDNILYELFEGIDKVESISLGEDIVKDKNNFTLKKVM